MLLRDEISISTIHTLVSLAHAWSLSIRKLALPDIMVQGKFWLSLYFAYRTTFCAIMESFLLLLMFLMVKKRKPVSQRTIYRKNRLPSINKLYKTNAKRLKSTIISDDQVGIGTNTSDMETSGDETDLSDSFSPVPSSLQHSSEHSNQHTYR